MATLKLRRFCLSLFDGEAGAAGAGATGGEQGVPAAAGQEKTGEAPVVYGRQPEAAEPDSGAAAAPQTDGAEPEDKPDLDAEFRELVRGKYKDQYTRDTQRLIDRRFRSAKQSEEQLKTLKPALDTLAKYYGMDADKLDTAALAKAISDDDVFIAAAAEAAGMDNVTYRHIQRVEAENRALRSAAQEREQAETIRRDAERLRTESESLRAKYPAFDLQEIFANEGAVAAFQAGAPLEVIYQGLHYQELVQGEIQQARAKTEKAVTDNIRAKGSRPAENGASSQGAAFTVKADPSKLTLEDYEEIQRRVRRGEQVAF